jgi:hypothetical protein
MHFECRVAHGLQGAPFSRGLSRLLRGGCGQPDDRFVVVGGSQLRCGFDIGHRSVYRGRQESRGSSMSDGVLDVAVSASGLASRSDKPPAAVSPPHLQGLPRRAGGISRLSFISKNSSRVTQISSTQNFACGSTQNKEAADHPKATGRLSTLAGT